MDAFNKISLLLGFQILLMVSMVGAAWVGLRLSNLQKQIPQELLQAHRNRLGWLPMVPIIAYLICSLINDFSGKSHWIRAASGLCYLLAGGCYLFRAILTLKSVKKLPGGLILLAIFESVLSLLAIAVGVAMMQID